MTTSFNIIEWIGSVASSTSEIAPNEDCDEPEWDRDNRHRKRPKRARDRDDRFPFPYNTQGALSSPPMKEMDVEGKHPPRRCLERDYLLMLETPVYIQPLAPDNIERPGLRQVRCLYEQVTDNQWKRGVVPDEVRDRFTAAYRTGQREAPISDCFRRADPSLAADDDNLTPAEVAKAEFLVLQDIQREAATSKIYQRHEAGWITNVYAPLLHHVFRQQPGKQSL
ncbi:hypothetical protein F5B20DRAFT_554154 [Whalleya microplaca]|nr:hypothetical protein F5B20DRAFT_554154 [Whalleya microplaca]